MDKTRYLIWATFIVVGSMTCTTPIIFPTQGLPISVVEAIRCDSLTASAQGNLGQSTQELIVQLDTIIDTFFLDGEIRLDTTLGFEDSLFVELKRRYFFDQPDVVDGFTLKKVCACGFYAFSGIPPMIDIEDTRKKGRTKQEDDHILSIGQNMIISLPSPFDSTLIEIPAPQPDSIPKKENKTKLVKVAVIDSGIDYFHSDLDSVLWKGNDIIWNIGDTILIDKDTFCLRLDSIGYDFVNGDFNSIRTDSFFPFDKMGHGTHISGIIANNIPSDIALQLISLKVFDENSSDLFTATCAINYAIQMDVDIINLSWGFYGGEPPGLLWDIFKQAAEKDILIVTSLGNENLNVDCCPHWPSGFSGILDNVISVTARDTVTNKLTSYSNYVFLGGRADIAAEGEFNSSFIKDKLPLGRHSTRKEIRGTSMATGLVSRSMAILKANKQKSSFFGLIKALKDSSIPLDSTIVRHTEKDTWHNLDSLGIQNIIRHE